MEQLKQFYNSTYLNIQVIDLKPSNENEWKKAHSNSKNMDYYYSVKNMKECYWKVADMPEYWCFFLDEHGERKVFNIVTGEKKDGNTTKTIPQNSLLQSKSQPIKSTPKSPQTYTSSVSNPKSGNSNDVAHHYNKIQSLDREEREESKIKHLRQVNNIIKTSLIQKYCPKKDASVLDLACGKGGDMGKWNFNKIKKYVGRITWVILI